MSNKNVVAKVEGDELVIRVNLKEPGTPSKTGKSMVVGTTSGFATVEGAAGIKIGLNVIRQQ